MMKNERNMKISSSFFLNMGDEARVVLQAVLMLLETYFKPYSIRNLAFLFVTVFTM